MSNLETIRSISTQINSVGAHFMFSPTTIQMGTDAGLSHQFETYCLGRGGVLGDVEADVVVSAFGFFAPSLIQRFWTSGREKLSPRAAGTMYAQAASQFGRDNLGSLPGMDRLADLGERVIAAADSPALALFAGWRAEPLPEESAARAYQVLHVLREHRGSAHLVAVLASGLTAFQASAAKNNNNVKMFGWKDQLADVAAFESHLGVAEQLTDQLVTPAFGVLDEDELTEFASLVNSVQTQLSPA